MAPFDTQIQDIVSIGTELDQKEIRILQGRMELNFRQFERISCASNFIRRVVQVN